METNSQHLFPDEISDEELRSYSCRSFGGEIVLVDTIERFREVLPELRRDRVYGFDTETRPAFRKGQKNRVALLQLSTANRAYLFRLNLIGLPAGLAEILSDHNVVKAGVAIHDDIKLLQSRQQFVPGGFIDLQPVAVENGIKNLGLKKLAAIFLGFRISKKQQVTDWEAATLSEAQMIYAATDAWICHEIYIKLKENDFLTG
jgi:ribonuclease D